MIPLGLSLGQASAILLAMFTVGACANAGRATLMRISGMHRGYYHKGRVPYTL